MLALEAFEKWPGICLETRELRAALSPVSLEQACGQLETVSAAFTPRPRDPVAEAPPTKHFLQEISLGTNLGIIQTVWLLRLCVSMLVLSTNCF